MKLISEFYYSNRTRQKMVYLCSLASILKEMLFMLLVEFLHFACYMRCDFIVLESLGYSAGKANFGSSAAIAEQPATTLLI